jgi:hypothetical protein
MPLSSSRANRRWNKTQPRRLLEETQRICVEKTGVCGAAHHQPQPHFFPARRETEILEQPQTAAHVHDQVNVDVHVIVDVFGFFFASRNSQTRFFRTASDWLPHTRLSALTSAGRNYNLE